jgi:hypothetical protein
MGAAYVVKDNRLPSRSVAVFGQPWSIRPELTGIALALEDCPGEEDLNIIRQSQLDEAAKEHGEARFSSAALPSHGATAPSPRNKTD